MQDLTGKTILVTGASQGIGKAAAVKLAAYGANLVIGARNIDKLTAVEKEISRSGGEVLKLRLDVSDYESAKRTAENAAEVFGGIDVLVNNAGIIEPISRIDESDPVAWNQVLTINTLGVYHMSHAVLPQMLNQGSGTMINMSSGAANGPLEGWSHYCASKAAAHMLTRCLDKEYGEMGITAVGLSPGTVATDMMQSIKNSGVNPVSKIPWENHIQAEWPAEAIAYLCTSAAEQYAGTDFSIKTEEGRKAVGLS
ncbi:MAG: SDR family oxidoreductase [Pseudomonadota bacterium]